MPWFREHRGAGAVRLELEAKPRSHWPWRHSVQGPWWQRWPCPGHWSALPDRPVMPRRFSRAGAGPGPWVDRSGNEWPAAVVVRARPWILRCSDAARSVAAPLRIQKIDRRCTRRSSRLSHACWLVFYPLAGWLGARAGFPGLRSALCGSDRRACTDPQTMAGR